MKVDPLSLERSSSQCPLVCAVVRSAKEQATVTLMGGQTTHVTTPERLAMCFMTRFVAHYELCENRIKNTAVKVVSRTSVVYSSGSQSGVLDP